MAQTVKILQGPSPVETTILHFKLQCKVKIFDTKIKYASGNCCVVAASQHYGLIFVGTTTGFLIIKADSLNSLSSPDNYLCKNFHLNLRPAFLSIDSSQKILAVTCNSKAGAIMFLFSIAVLLSKKMSPLKFHAVSHLAKNPTAEVVDVVWQPNADGGMVVCMTDGSILSFSQPTTNEPPFTLPSTTQATCLCWSPKGKQIVIGSAEGTLAQYKPDLKLVKTLPKPPLYFENITVLSVLWISNYQFLAAYTSRDDPNFFPIFTIYNAVKNEPINVINFEDVTYTTNLFRIHQPYMIHQVAWNMIFVTSSNSIEVAVLYSNDGTAWEQWLMGDASRAELPLNSNKEETFPLGWAFDYTSTEAIPWGEGSLPPMPRLLILTDEGLLCVFNVVNTTPNIPQLCAAPKETIDQSLFSKITPLADTEAVPFDAQKGGMGMEAAFGNSKPSFGSAATFEALSAQPQVTSSVPQVAGAMTQMTQIGSVSENKDTQPPLQQPQSHQLQQQQSLQPTQLQLNQPITSTPHFGAPAALGTNYSITITKVTPPTTTVTKIPTSFFGVKPPAPQTEFSFSSNIPQSTPIKIPEPAPPKETPKLESTKKPEEKAEEPPADSENTPEVATVDDSVYLKALQEEVDHFDSELRELKAKVNSLDIQLGTDEDKLKMRKSIERFSEFWKELKETTEGQSGEIHAVVMDLMEAFAWLENAKSRNLQRKNPSYIELKKSEELDPLSVKHMSEISQLKYYIENQLKQLSNYLDKEWMDHQENYRNQIKKQMAVPPLEEVYKTMHLQLKILHKQRMLVEELKDKVSTRKRKSPMSITNDSLINTSTPNRYSELSKLAQNLLQLKIDKMEPPKEEASEILKSHLQSIAERSRKLSQGKQAALREALSERDTVKIRPVKTSLETSSFLRTLASQQTTQFKPKPIEISKPEIKSQPQIAQPMSLNFPQSVPQPQPPAQPQPHSVPQIILQSQPQPAIPSRSLMEVEKPAEKSTPQPETPKTIFVFGKAKAPENPVIPLTVQAIPKPEEKSPLASLSGIVSNIGKKQEPAFVFGTPKPETKPEQKPEEKTFTFGAVKPAEAVFGGKPNFTFGSAKPATTKPEVNITPVTTTTVATTTGFTFSFGSATTATTLPKMNISFGKEQPTLTTTALIFGGTKTTNLFGTPKTTEASSQVAFNLAKSTNKVAQEKDVVVSVVKKTEEVDVVNVEDDEEKKPETPKEPTPPIAVTTVADTPVVTSAQSITTTVVTTTETIDSKATTTSIAPTLSTSSPIFGQGTTTTSMFGKPPSTTVSIFGQVSSTTDVFGGSTTTNKFSSSAFAKPLFGSNTFGVPASTTTSTLTFGVSTPSTTTSVFELSTAPAVAATTATVFGVSTPSTTTPIVFGVSTAVSTANTTSTVTTATTTASIFGVSTPATTTSVFAVTTASTTTVFGTTTTFGATTPTSSVFGATTQTATAFGNTTPTTDTIFGSSSTSPTFGQKPGTVTQTANLFSQLLSDNKSVFRASTTASTTTANIFSTPKNIFGGASTTTAPLFGTPTTSIFPQTTSVFGQPTTTTSSNIFGQAQTPTSNAFFNQNICSPFGGARQTTPNQSFESFNKPIFGGTTFGQTSGNTATFGSSSSSSIFGGSSTSGNVFQTPTTSSTCGTTSPGRFSGGGGSVAETGFGSTTNTFQSPMGGFGSPPVFGGSPPASAFGGSPTFGGSASFGSLPSFGNFSSQGGFGQTSGSATFGTLASQNTVGFESLAQQSQNQGFGTGNVFGSSRVENKPAFGGNSFSSWRS